MRYLLICSVLLFSYVAQAQVKINVALVQSGFVWGDADANIKAFEKRLKTIGNCDLINLENPPS